MTDAERVRKEAFLRTSKYKIDNAGDFPAGSIQAAQIAAIDAELVILNTQPCRHTPPLRRCQKAHILTKWGWRTLRPTGWFSPTPSLPKSSISRLRTDRNPIQRALLTPRERPLRR
ncbi:MAG: hypothetical protein IPI64_05335 [Chloracidobacterium sp.]|nr:hypothetical protein [Chloracidobacterium sp.]